MAPQLLSQKPHKLINSKCKDNIKQLQFSSDHIEFCIANDHAHSNVRLKDERPVLATLGGGGGWSYCLMLSAVLKE